MLYPRPMVQTGRAPDFAADRLRALVNELLADRRMTQGDLAKQVLKVDPATLSRALNRKQPVTHVMAETIAKAVGFDARYFYSESAKSYREFQVGAEHILAGARGTAKLGDALEAARQVLRQAGETDVLPELAEALAIDVLSLDCVQAAYQVLKAERPEDRRAPGAALAWKVLQLAEDPDLVDLVTRRTAPREKK